MRPDLYFIPISVDKCVPMVNSCPQTAICAHSICKGADKGRSLVDYSNSYLWVAGRCMHFLPASKFREAPKEAKAAHESVKGLA